MASQGPNSFYESSVSQSWNRGVFGSGYQGNNWDLCGGPSFDCPNGGRPELVQVCSFGLCRWTLQWVCNETPFDWPPGQGPWPKLLEGGDDGDELPIFLPPEQQRIEGVLRKQEQKQEQDENPAKCSATADKPYLWWVELKDGVVIRALHSIHMISCEKIVLEIIVQGKQWKNEHLEFPSGNSCDYPTNECEHIAINPSPSSGFWYATTLGKYRYGRRWHPILESVRSNGILIKSSDLDQP